MMNRNFNFHNISLTKFFFLLWLLHPMSYLRNFCCLPESHKYSMSLSKRPFGFHFCIKAYDPSQINFLIWVRQELKFIFSPSI